MMPGERVPAAEAVGPDEVVFTAVDEALSTPILVSGLRLGSPDRDRGVAVVGIAAGFPTAVLGEFEMSSAEEALRTGLQYHRAGDFERAACLYRSILEQQPDHCGAWHLLGVVCHQQGEPALAIEHISRAIALDSSKAVYHNNLGVALRADGRLTEAREAYGQALKLNPSYADAHSNLAVVLHEEGNYEEAVAAFERALRIQPDHPDALYNLGNLYRDQGRTSQAIAYYSRTLEIRPNRAEAHNNLASALLAERRAGEAIASYQRALELDPDCAEAHLNLGVAYSQLDMIDEAGRCYERACRLRPNKVLWKMRTAGLCPAIFPSVEEIDRYRQDLERQLDRFGATPLSVDWRELAVEGFNPSFYLSHHGRNNRPLKEKFAALFAPCFPRQRRLVGTGNPRVGFLVTRHHEGGFLRGTSGIIEHLDRSRFEPVVLCSESVLDRCRRSIRRADVQWIGFPDHFSSAVKQVAAARCDVLYHWQIGTDPLNYFLPFANLAPVQCTGWGTHGTSGISAVDYYLSSRLIETEGSEEHYTETLYRFETIPTYQPHIPPPGPADRSSFGLPERGNLYACPQRLPKFHPDFDPILRAILEADPQGYLILLEGSSVHAVAQLRKRFERTLGAVVGRLVFLPAQDPGAYYRLLSLADVVLDPPHYSSSLTGYDAFALALPVATLPGTFNVERYALGLYRKMGIAELVADSPEDYVKRAARLGTDRDYRHWVRSYIAERSEVLFEDMEAVREHERFFEQALEQAKQSCS